MNAESWQHAESSQFGLMFPGRFWKMPRHSSLWSLTLSSCLRSPWLLACFSRSGREVPSVVGCDLLLINPSCYSVPGSHCPCLSRAPRVATSQKQLELDLPLVHVVRGKDNVVKWKDRADWCIFPNKCPLVAAHIVKRMVIYFVLSYQSGSRDNQEIILDLEPKSPLFTS